MLICSLTIKCDQVGYYLSFYPNFTHDYIHYLCSLAFFLISASL
jgi:hypothetical protein